MDDGKSALIIAPSHAEGERLTGELRETLKARGAIGKETRFMVRKSTGWTDAQKGDGRNYQPGMVVEFSQNAKGFTKGDKAVVVHGGNEVLLQKQDGIQVPLATDNAERFEVYRARELAIGKGDRIRITKNGAAKADKPGKGAKINNGNIFTVEGFAKEGDIRLENGKLLPKDYGHFTSGYVDTSYASQSKTVDREFVAVGNESRGATNRQQWYVSLSRTREHQTNAQAFALSVVFKDRRRRQSFPWSMYGGHEWTDDGDIETIAVLFGERGFIVRGYRFAALDRDLSLGKRASIREHTKAQVDSMLAEEGEEPIILSVETFPPFPELLASLKGEETHDHRHARRP